MNILCFGEAAPVRPAPPEFSMEYIFYRFPAKSIKSYKFLHIQDIVAYLIRDQIHDP